MVVAVDLGTTAVKALAVTADGWTLAPHRRAVPLVQPRPGAAVVDADTVEAAAVDATRAAVADAQRAGHEVVALVLGGAMHSIVPIDDDGSPLAPVVTWADARAVPEADELRTRSGVDAVIARTGTPLHALSPMVKLRWFARHRPDLVATARRWVGLKDLVLARWCGQWLVDTSMASATGLLDLVERRWSNDALALAGVDADRLPEVVPPATLVRLGSGARAMFGLEGSSVRVVVGAADGPLANLGLGVLGPGPAACSIGTSGAVRVTVPEPVLERASGEFCYLLDDDHAVVGAATSNGGVVLDWLRELLGPHPGDLDEGRSTTATLLASAAAVPAGSDGLVLVPHLLAERAPGVDPRATGALVGLTRRHTRAHVARAAVEGVAGSVASLVDGLVERGRVLDELRVTGGLTRHALVRQCVADASGRTVVAPHETGEASALGAALLGWVALGAHRSLEDAARVASRDATRVEPSASSARLRARAPLVAALDAALAPLTRALADEAASTG